MNSPPPTTERRPIYEHQSHYPMNPYQNNRQGQVSEFSEKIRKAPNSNSNRLVVKWDSLKNRYDFSNFDPERYYNKISKEDVMETFRVLYQEEKYRSIEDNSNCLDTKTLVITAFIIFLALISMILITVGQGFLFASFGLILLGIIVIVVRILMYLVGKKNYHKRRELKYKEIARKLNQGRFIDKPFTVEIGELAAWVEFLVTYVENERPNRGLQAGNYYPHNINNQNNIFKSQEIPESHIIQPQTDPIKQFDTRVNNPFTPSPIAIQDFGNYSKNVSNFNPNVAKPSDVRIYERNMTGNENKRTFTTFGEASFGKENIQRRYNLPSGTLASRPQIISKIRKPALKPDLGSIESDTFESTTRNKRIEKATYTARNYSTSQSKKYSLPQRRVVYSPSKENYQPNRVITPKKLNYTPQKINEFSSRRVLTPQRSRPFTPTKRLPPIVRYISNSPSKT